MTMITNSEIMQKLMALTKATVVETSQEDQELLAKLQEENVQAAKDRKQVDEYKAKVKREKAILEQAKGFLAN